MASVRRTAKAEEDLVDLWLYIAQDNTDAADRLLKEPDRKCALLAENGAGARMPGDRPRAALLAGWQLPHSLSGS